MNVKLPDGTVIQNVPDGTTQEDLMRQFEAFQAQRASKQPDASMRGYNPPERNLMSSAAHGGLDIAEGAAQIASRGASALGLPPGSDYPFIASPDVVQKSVQGARESIDKRLGAPQPQGMDLARMASAGIAATPFAGPVGTAATTLGRAAQAGRAGMIQGGLQPVDNATSNFDFAKTKAFQIGAGGVTGSGAQAGLEFGAKGLANIAKSVTDRASGLMRDTSENAAALYAAQTLAQQGIKFNTLNQDVQKSLIKDVQEAMKKYGGVNAAALARKSDFDELGVDPLKPWVTRDPVEFGKYKNLEASDAGDPLKRAKADLDRTLFERLEAKRGPNTGDYHASGTLAGNILSRTHKVRSDGVTGLYEQFRATAPNVSADPKRLVDTILNGVEGQALGDFLSPELRNLVNSVARGERPTTPDALYRLQQIANTEVRKGGNAGAAARQVAKGIDDELEQMGRDMALVGPEMKDAAELLKKARAAHRSLKLDEEAIPALKAVAEGKFAAEDFFNSYIKDADVKEVAAMWTRVDNPALKQAARSQLIDYLKKSAAGSNAPADAPFRNQQFTEAVSGPGMSQKIRIILGERGLEEVERVRRAGESASRIPSGTRYNTSGTAMELMNLANRSAGVPGVGPFVQKLIADAKVSGMNQPAGSSAIGQGLLDPFYEELLKRSRQGIGLLSPAIGGGVAGSF